MAIGAISNAARRLRDDDTGQLILMIGFVAVFVALLITVVVNATKVYLTQASLYAASDAAASAGANALDPSLVTQGSASQVLPLSEQSIRDHVQAFIVGAGFAQKFHEFEVLEISTNGRSVVVRFGARVKMPFANLVSGDYRRGYAVSSTSSATARIRD